MSGEERGDRKMAMYLAACAAALVALGLWHGRFQLGGSAFAYFATLAVLIWSAVNEWYEHRRWSHWSAVVASTCYCLIGGYIWWLGSFTLGVFMFGWGALALTTTCFLIRAESNETRTNEDEEEEEREHITIVLLLREHRFIDSAILAQMASRAWGREVRVASDDDEDNDAPLSETGPILFGDMPWMISFWPGMFSVLNVNDTYFKDCEEMAEAMPEMRTANAVLNHTAWMSVSLIRWNDEPNPQRVDQVIARLLAEFCDDNTLAVAIPRFQAIYPYESEIDQKLRAEDPLEALEDNPLVPVMKVAPDSEAMAKAVGTARSRWAEFVSAFEARDPEESSNRFNVKARFSDGHEGDNERVEFMWMSVTAIEGDRIYGLLGNQPAGIPSLNEGDRVSVSLSDLNDWMIMNDDGYTGGFTVSAIFDANE